MHCGRFVCVCSVLLGRGPSLRIGGLNESLAAGGSETLKLRHWLSLHESGPLPDVCSSGCSSSSLSISPYVAYITLIPASYRRERVPWTYCVIVHAYLAVVVWRVITTADICDCSSVITCQSWSAVKIENWKYGNAPEQRTTAVPWRNCKRTPAY